MVRGLLTYNILPNLLGNHPPMQMDGNWGITAAVCEMLVQSQAGEINLLPALPSVWPTGSIKGLRARGAFTVDIVWKDGRLSRATIRSTGGHKCRVRYGDKVTDVTLSPGQSRVLDGTLDPM
jgi:alpha-L-fucosidase 2